MSQAKEEEIHGTDDLVSKLPTREGWSQQPMVLYKNYWLRPHIAATIMRLQSSFKPRPDDIILATNPKCGTTWLKALSFTIRNRSRYGFANHPLLFSHPQQVVQFIEISLDGSPTYVESLEALPSHFENKMCRGHRTDLEAAFSMFSQGFSSYGPFWDHCLEYWKESIASPDKVLFLKYEDMISEPVEHVVRLAAFLGAPFSIEEEGEGVPEEVVRLCSFENLSSLPVNQTGDFGRHGDLVLDKSMCFRKGKVGDWVNHLIEEMGRELDCIVEEKLRGSGLVL